MLREVGTTNRTRLADYEHAINEKTRVLLRVHPSNFQVTGFTEKPDVAELVALGQRANLPVVEDLGSGCLVDLSAHGITEPTARESISAGFSLVLFSGDKLLGRSSSRDHRGAERTGRQSSPSSAVPRTSRGQANHHRSRMHSARLSARRLGGSAFPAHDSLDHYGNCSPHHQFLAFASAASRQRRCRVGNRRWRRPWLAAAQPQRNLCPPR